MENLQLIQYQGVRVLTTQQVAEAYETETKIISNNFNRNKDRYIEGKHFICLEGQEKRDFINLHQFDDGCKNAYKLYLWTKKGAFLHAKSLNTDVAWEVYERLVDNYFDSQPATPKLPVTPMNLSPQLQLLINMELKQKEQDAAISELKEKTDKLEYDIPLYGSEADGICNHVKRKGVEMLGGKQSNAYKDNKIRHAVYSDIYNQIKREFGLYDDKGRYKSYKALKRRYIYDAHEVISAYELPAYLAERIRNCNAQINMEVA